MTKKYLFLSHDYRGIPIDSAIDVLRETASIDVAVLSRRQARHLRWTLWRLKAHQYNATLIDLPFKHLHYQGPSLQKLPNPIVYDEDAYQDRIPHRKWFGKFSSFYKQFHRIKVLNTGYQTMGHFRRQGIDSAFAPKGHDERILYPEGLEYRDIEVGFVGRLRSNVYRERAELINAATNRLSCQVMRTHTPDEYRNTLNRIRFFFSADRGLGEYMAKNFEAMSCGCVLVAWRQGEGEEDFLGLVDGQNCVLYSSIDEAEKKIHELKKDHSKFRHIQEQGTKLAKNRFSHTRLGQTLRDTLKGGALK